RRAVAVAAGVYEDAPTAVGLAELLREMLRITLDEHRPYRVRATPDRAKSLLTVEWNDNVKPLRTRRLHPTRQIEFTKQIAQRECGRSKHVGLVVSSRVEIENTDIGGVEVRDAGGPDVRRDRVLVGQPEQRSRIGHERMVHRAIFLGHFDTLQPRGKPFRNILVKETLLANARWVSFQGDRPLANVREHDRRDRFVIRRELALGDPIVWKQHLLGVRDHGAPLPAGTSLVTS